MGGFLISPICFFQAIGLFLANVEGIPKQSTILIGKNKRETTTHTD
jgi:hypothetical protein